MVPICVQIQDFTDLLIPEPLYVLARKPTTQDAWIGVSSIRTAATAGEQQVPRLRPETSHKRGNDNPFHSPVIRILYGRGKSADVTGRCFHW